MTKQTAIARHVMSSESKVFQQRLLFSRVRLKMAHKKFSFYKQQQVIATTQYSLEFKALLMCEIVRL